MSLVMNLINAFQRAANEDKALRTLLNGNAVDLSALSTATKANLVAAINELVASIGGAGANINDATTSTTAVWSSSKTDSTIVAAVAALVASSPAALDTLNELATALGNDADFATTVATALGNRLRVDTAQALSAPQKAQGNTNLGSLSLIDAGDPNTDFVAIFTAALA